MRAARSVASFLAALLLVGCVVFLTARPEVHNWICVLQNGWGLDTYETVGVGSSGMAAAVDWTGEEARLICFTAQGEQLGNWSVRLPQEEAGGTVSSIYPVRADLAFLAVYDENGQHLTLYRIEAGGQVERLLRETCRGASSAERRAGTRLYGFSQDGGEISFACISEGEVRAYRFPAEGGGIEQTAQEEAGEDVSGATVLPDGTLALGGDGWLTLDGETAAADLSGQTVAQLTRTGSGLYYVDTTAFRIWYTDLTGAGARQVLSLPETVSGHQLTALALTDRGGALALLDGHTLHYVDESGTEDWTALLYQSRAAAGIKLAGGTLGVLLAASLLWYLACGARRGRMPLAAHWGGMLVVVALAITLVLQEALLRPEGRRSALNSNRTVVEGVVQLALISSDLTQADLPRQLAQVLEVGGRYHNVKVSVARQSGKVWLTQAGTFAAMEEGFDPSLADLALVAGSAAGLENDIFQYALSQGEWVLLLTMEIGAQEDPGLAGGVAAGIALVTAVAVLALLLVNWDIRRLARGMECLSEGRRSGQFRLPTGDELEGMASTLNSLAASLERGDRERETLAQSYRRFVPEPVLGLLGKQSILEVDKNTFASRRMVVMMVWFTFPDPVYSGANSRLLFDSVNRVIERTASIATQKGGTVFNFAYNGYDVVMEEDLRQMVSTAVAIQQEVLALNELRGQEKLPAVSLRIALDVGDVLVGVVGDSTQLEPTIISSSFSTVRELINLCGRLEAGILCTEAVIAGAEGYGNRYLGKCWMGQTPVRVYEIFDGDPYGVRKGKESTVRQFSRGVLQLYSGDTAEAKRIFLELAHDNPGDGSVRYYLYLADRLEEHPDQPCGLNGD